MNSKAACRQTWLFRVNNSSTGMVGVLPVATTPSEFGRFVNRENERVELKTGTGRKPLQATLVAMSNTDGGYILIGVTDDRTVVGARRDQGVDDDIHGAAFDATNVGRRTHCPRESPRPSPSWCRTSIRPRSVVMFLRRR